MSEQDDTPIPLSDDNAPLEVVGADASAASADAAGSRVRQSAGLGQQMRAAIQFQRSVNLTGQGAVRCRLFHTSLSAASLAAMEDQINEWLDGEQVEVKHVCQTIGVLRGKANEENLIVTVWY